MVGRGRDGSHGSGKKECSFTVSPRPLRFIFQMAPRLFAVVVPTSIPTRFCVGVNLAVFSIIANMELFYLNKIYATY